MWGSQALVGLPDCSDGAQVYTHDQQAFSAFLAGRPDEAQIFFEKTEVTGGLGREMRGLGSVHCTATRNT